MRLQSGVEEREKRDTGEGGGEDTLRNTLPMIVSQTHHTLGLLVPAVNNGEGGRREKEEGGEGLLMASDTQTVLLSWELVLYHQWNAVSLFNTHSNW